MKRALAVFLLSPAVWAQPSIPCNGCRAIAGADGALYTTGPSAPACTEGGSGDFSVARYLLYAAAPDWVACVRVPGVASPTSLARTKAGTLLIGSSGQGMLPRPWLIEFDPVTRRVTSATSIGLNSANTVSSILERDDGSVVAGGDGGWIALVSAPPRAELWTKPRPSEFGLQLAGASAGRFYLSSLRSFSGQGAQLKLLEADGETEVWRRTLPSSSGGDGWKLLADASGGVWVAGATIESNLVMTPDAWQPQHSGSPLYRYDFGYWFGHLAGLDVPGVRTIVPHPDSRVVYFAAASDGVYRTDNNGWTWTRRSTGLPPGGVSALAMTTDGLRAISGLAVYRSTDQGLSWSLVNASMPLNRVNEISADGDRLYAAGDQLLRSDDLGATWQRVLGGVNGVSAAGGRVLAVIGFALPIGIGGVSGALIESSSDGGATWIQTRLPGPSVFQVRFDPARDGVAWAATGNGVLRSLDAGRTWSPIDLGRTITSLAFLPEDPRYLFAAASDSSVWRIDKDSGTSAQYAPRIAFLTPGSLAMGDTGVPLLGVSVQPALIRRYSASGDILYSTWFGGLRAEQVGGIAADQAGGVAVTGTTRISGWAGSDSRPVLLGRPFVFWLRPNGPFAGFFDQDPFNAGIGIQWMTTFGWWLNTGISVVPVWIVP